MKIIRDKYTDIIDSKKLFISTDEKQRKMFLVKKVKEEMQEIVDSKFKDPEEYGDLIEVLYAIADINNISPGEIDHARKKKLQEFGGFKNGVYLKQD
ncbi:MAG: hypothetical protein KAI79_13670 [Bacteroidales bacterium]|nr:hypothetical protein [Bacteroidales bacterium]